MSSEYKPKVFSLDFGALAKLPPEEMAEQIRSAVEAFVEATDPQKPETPDHSQEPSP